MGTQTASAAHANSSSPQDESLRYLLASFLPEQAVALLKCLEKTGVGGLSFPSSLKMYVI